MPARPAGILELRGRAVRGRDRRRARRRGSRPPADGAVVVFLGRTRVTPGTPAPGQEAEAARHAGRARRGARVRGARADGAAGPRRRSPTRSRERFGVERLAIVHRTGDGPARRGERRIVVAVAPHRDAAFAAARYAIDETKARAPIWKAERFADGHVWIGHPARTGPGDAGRRITSPDGAPPEPRPSAPPPDPTIPPARRSDEGLHQRRHGGHRRGQPSGPDRPRRSRATRRPSSSWSARRTRPSRAPSTAAPTEVVVNDSHGSMFNLDQLAPRPRARLLQGQKAWSMVEGAGPGRGFGVALFVGYHARAGHPTGDDRPHLLVPAGRDATLNGRPVGESGHQRDRPRRVGRPGRPGQPATTCSPRRSPTGCPWAERVVVKEARRAQRRGLAPSQPRPGARPGRRRRRAVRRAIAGELRPLVARAAVRGRGRLPERRPGRPTRRSCPGAERIGETDGALRRRRPGARLSRVPRRASGWPVSSSDRRRGRDVDLGPVDRLVDLAGTLAGSWGAPRPDLHDRRPGAGHPPDVRGRGARPDRSAARLGGRRALRPGPTRPARRRDRPPLRGRARRVRDDAAGARPRRRRRAPSTSTSRPRRSPTPDRRAEAEAAARRLGGAALDRIDANRTARRELARRPGRLGPTVGRRRRSRPRTSTVGGARGGDARHERRGRPPRERPALRELADQLHDRGWTSRSGAAAGDGRPTRRSRGPGADRQPAWRSRSSGRPSTRSPPSDAPMPGSRPSPCRSPPRSRPWSPPSSGSTWSPRTSSPRSSTGGWTPTARSRTTPSPSGSSPDRGPPCSSARAPWWSHRISPGASRRRGHPRRPGVRPPAGRSPTRRAQRPFGWSAAGRGPARLAARGA